MKKEKNYTDLTISDFNRKLFVPEYQPWFPHAQQNSTSTSGFVEYMENHIKMELIFPNIINKDPGC